MERQDTQHPVILVQIQDARELCHQTCKIAVGEHHAFRVSCSARSEDERGEGISRDPLRQFCDSRLLNALVFEGKDHMERPDLSLQAALEQALLQPRELVEKKIFTDD